MKAISFANITMQSLSHNFATEISGNVILSNKYASLASLLSWEYIFNSHLCSDVNFLPSGCFIFKGRSCFRAFLCGESLVKKWPDEPESKMPRTVDG